MRPLVVISVVLMFLVEVSMRRTVRRAVLSVMVAVGLLALVSEN